MNGDEENTLRHNGTVIATSLVNPRHP